MKTILASASPRRQELLQKITDNFEILVSDFNEEEVSFMGDPAQYVMEVSKGKVLSVAQKLNEEAIIIGCDTVVFFKNKILGKPKDEREAYNMLNSLSGNTHEVYSGLSILNTSTDEIKIDFEKTYVKFSSLQEEDINKYIATGEPFDKAGAYGIQGKASIFVEQIKGCYYSVVGLPLNKLHKILRDMGVNF